MTSNGDKEVAVLAHGLGQAVIAVDGPSGAGKSTVSRAVAKRLGLRYLDTGAMYRALTWAALHDGLDLDDGDQLSELAARADLRISTEPVPTQVWIGSEEVSTAIRGAEVTGAVSRVSAVPGVREALVRRQRELIGAGGIVVEGRDIGSVVVPEATVKVFLTASGATRAQRRQAELADGAVETTEAAMQRRDQQDSTRATSPLTRSPDAVEIDSTDLDVEQVVDRVIALLPSDGRLPS